MDVIPATAPKSITQDTNFNNYLLIVDAFSKIPKIYGLENITTEEVLDKQDMFQARYGKIDQFGWWDLDRISADAGTQFTLAKFKEECQLRGVRLTLAAPKHQEMNGQVEVTWRTLRTIAHSHGTRSSSRKLYAFRFDVHDRPYIPGSTY